MNSFKITEVGSGTTRSKDGFDLAASMQNSLPNFYLFSDILLIWGCCFPN